MCLLGGLAGRKWREAGGGGGGGGGGGPRVVTYGAYSTCSDSQSEMCAPLVQNAHPATTLHIPLVENAHPPFPISNLRPSRAKRPSSHQVAECGRREEEEDGHGLPQHTEQRQQLAEEEGIKPPKAHTLPHDS